jgi:hypothetical protein
MTHQKQLEHVEYLSYLDSIITDDARFMEIMSKFAMAKARFNKAFFLQQIELKFKQ